MAKTDGKPAGVKPADNVKPADVKKPRKGSQNSLSLSPRWTLHVTRPFNLYKEGQGTPRGTSFYKLDKLGLDRQVYSSRDRALL